MNIPLQKPTRFLWVLALLLVLTVGVSTSAQVPEPSLEKSNGVSVLNTSTKRHLTTMTTSDDPSGLRIILGTSTPVDDAVGYRSGDYYVVVIPQAEMSPLQIDMRLLKSLRIEARDEDLVVSFKLDGVTKPQLTREENRLVVTLLRSTQSAAADSAPTVAVATSPAPAVAPANPVNPAPQLTSAAFDAIAQLFGTKSVDVANLDLSTPESPAFAVLDLTPQTIVRPASPREFASSLINGLDKNGNFQSGLAIDTAPFLLLNGRNVTLEAYNNDWLTRFLTRIQFSLAAAKGSSEDDPTTKLSLGLNFTLIDDGDPRIYRQGEEGDVLTCFQQNIHITDPPVPPQLPGETDEQRQIKRLEFQAAVLKNSNAVQIAEQCREEGRKKHWNRNSWSFALAPSWISKTGDSSDFKWNGGGLWTSYALGVGNTGQFIMHARYRAKEQVPDEANEGAFIAQNSALFGGRFRMGNPNVGFNIEGAFVHNRPENKPTKNTYEFSIGLEKKLAPNVYFVISAGSKGPQIDDGKSKGFVITSFKYGFSEKPKLATPSN